MVSASVNLEEQEAKAGTEHVQRHINPHVEWGEQNKTKPLLMETECYITSDSAVSQEWHGATRLLLITTSKGPEGDTSCLVVKALPDEGW